MTTENARTTALLDPLVMRAMSRARRGECDGACETRSDGHRGECRVVSVSQMGKAWGVFSYCEQAIEDDRTNHFCVVEWPA